MFQLLKNKIKAVWRAVVGKTADAEEEKSSIASRVRELEIKSKRLTNRLFTGEYHSAFKGQGMVFKEVREYQAGDDVRFIEWNASARTGNTYSKLFEEERELSVYLLVDSSASNYFGSFQQTKKDLIAEICAVIAFSAVNNNDKISLIFFSDKVEKYVPEKKGREHILRLVRDLLTFKSASAKTNIAKALQFLNSTAKHKSIVFLLSDFADGGYADQLGITAKKHDVIGIQVFDKLDKSLPKVGLLEIFDPETNKTRLIDTKDKEAQFRYSRQFDKIYDDAKNLFKKSGADLLQIETGEDFVKILQQFFQKRK